MKKETFCFANCTFQIQHTFPTDDHPSETRIYTLHPVTGERLPRKVFLGKDCENPMEPYCNVLYDYSLTDIYGAYLPFYAKATIDKLHQEKILQSDDLADLARKQGQKFIEFLAIDLAWTEADKVESQNVFQKLISLLRGYYPENFTRNEYKDLLDEIYDQDELEENALASIQSDLLTSFLSYLQMKNLCKFYMLEWNFCQDM